MIKLSKKGDYGLKALAYIAHRPGSVIKISDIAHDLKISESFLRRIMHALERKWLITTIQWRNGGVFLERDIASITLYEIFSCLEEDLFITDCTAGKYCANQENCVTTTALNALQKWFTSLLKMYTLDRVIGK